jgi:glucosamine--fructose-6-phosphate aminotransferase (isomerizing)
MCGIFGIVNGSQNSLSKDATKSYLKNLFLLSENRGQEAAGIASRLNDKTLVLRRPEKASRFIKSRAYKSYLEGLDFVDNSAAVIAHCRLVTDGYQNQHENNQPVISSGVVGVHNGIIVNKESLYTKYNNLKSRLDVDTEVMLDLCQNFRQQGLSLSEAVAKTYQEIRGSASIALLFEDLGSLVLATNNGSLYYAANVAQQRLFFASEAHILNTFLQKENLSNTFQVKQLDPDSAMIIDYKNGFTITPFSLNAATSIDGKQATRAEIFDIKPTSEYTTSHILNAAKPNPALLKFDETHFLSIHRCKKCLLPSTFPFIRFDTNGECSYCTNYIPIKKYGEEALKKQLENKDNVLLALSGGRDSCYALHYLAKDLGKNVKAYTYDWGVVTDLARRNMSIMCQDLNVEHIIVSADITVKRKNIRLNVEAWLKRPSLGMVPLFMAGDKQFFYYANRVREQVMADALIFGMNELERTNFKVAFCDIRQKEVDRHFGLSYLNQLEIIYYYLKQFALTPSYINSSIFDTVFAYFSYYLDKHDYTTLYHYLPWDEKRIESTLIGEYGWNTATDTTTTWRIGDGTAAFYNYIYWSFVGFTESDTFRSNQIREGMISRDEAMKMALEENRPRFEAIKWYCQTIGLDFNTTISRINEVANQKRNLRAP